MYHISFTAYFFIPGVSFFKICLVFNVLFSNSTTLSPVLEISSQFIQRHLEFYFTFFFFFK